MELKKYQQAIRAMTRRDSPLDTVIYDSSILEASDEQLGTSDMIMEDDYQIEGLDTMPSVNPEMDPVMPSVPGLDDPKELDNYRQMELAEGGVVDREGFYKAGLVGKGKNKGKYSIPKFYDAKTGIAKTVHFDSLEEANQAIENQKNKFKEFREKNKNTKAILNDPDKKAEFIKYANSPNVSGKDIAKKFGLTSSEFYTAGLRDLVTKDLQFQQASRIRSDTVKNMLLLHNDETAKKFIRKGEIVPHNILKKLGISSYPAASATVRLAQAYAGKDFGYDELKTIQKNKEASDKLFKTIEKSPFGNPYNSYLYTASLEAIDDQLGRKSGTFASLKSQAREILAENKIKGFDINEIAGVTGTAKSGAGEFAQFIDIMESNLNQKEMASFQSAFSRARSKIKNDPENFTTYAEKINDLALDFENRYGVTLSRIRKAEDVDKYYSPERLEELKKQGLDIKEASKKVGYTMEMPKGAVTIEEFVKNKEIQNKVIANFKESEQKLLNKMGTQLNSGIPINEIMNVLPEREAQMLRNMGSKIGKIAKIGARGVADLTTGLGPLGVAITALIETPVALAGLAEGKRGSEVTQDAISSITFGLVPDSEERVLKEIGGERAVKGLKIKKSIDAYRNAIQDLKNLNTELKDPASTLLSEDQDAILAGIERNQQIIQDQGKFLQQFIDPETRKFVASDYDYYKKVAKTQQKERDLTKQIRSEEGSGDYLPDFKEEETRKELDALKQTYEGNKKLESIDDIMDRNIMNPVYGGRINNYATGGRVGLKLGSGKKLYDLGKKIITNKKPENPDRRDFLKGAGLLGAGVAAGKLGLLGLSKVAKKASLTEIVAPMGKTTTEFPTWFPSLIKRVREEGTQIPIFKKAEVPLTEAQFNKLQKEGAENIYDRYQARTEEYIKASKEKGESRYIQMQDTDEIIGYKYEVKEMPGLKVKDMEGKEIEVEFSNAYGQEVYMTYTKPKISIDPQGQKIKYDAEFSVDDGVPELNWMGWRDDHHVDFYAETVKNIDEVLGGASKVEQYALKAKKPRITSGDEIVSRSDAAYDIPDDFD